MTQSRIRRLNEKKEAQPPQLQGAGGGARGFGFHEPGGGATRRVTTRGYDAAILIGHRSTDASSSGAVGHHQRLLGGDDHVDDHLEARSNEKGEPDHRDGEVGHLAGSGLVSCPGEGRGAVVGFLVVVSTAIVVAAISTTECLGRILAKLPSGFFYQADSDPKFSSGERRDGDRVRSPARLRRRSGMP